MNKIIAAHIRTIESYIDRIDELVFAYQLEEQPDERISEIKKAALTIKQRVGFIKEELCNEGGEEVINDDESKTESGKRSTRW